MATQQQLQQWLDDCEQALQDLSTGQKAVSVASTSGKSVTFTAANIGLLRTRIA